MSYTVLARRYRSEHFAQVVGQTAVTTTRRNAIATDRVAHAYLFTGTRGVGKTTMARILSKSLNCLTTDGPTQTPCLECESCLGISQGADMDVLDIDAASNTGVDHIRELRQNAIFRPARARFKIYIIDEVHMLSTSAFNALLKTLEEPPEHVKFIMATTESHKIPATILSRCQRFDFRPIGPADIAAQVDHILKTEQIEADEAAVKRIARLARGSMRDALSLLDQLLSMAQGKVTLELLDQLVGRQRSEQLIELIEYMSQNDLSGALHQVDRCLTEGMSLEQLAQDMQDHYRDLMLMASGIKAGELIDLDDQALLDRATEQAARYDLPTLVYAVTVTEELRRAVKTAGADRAFLEAAVIRLSAMEQFQDTRQALSGQSDAAVGGAAGASDQTTGQSRGTSPHSGKAPALKKKAEPVTEPGVAPVQPLDVPGQFDLDFLKTNWSRLIELAGPTVGVHLQICLRSAAPTHWQAPALSLTFTQPGLYKMISASSEKIDKLNDALTQLLKQNVRCDILLDEQSQTVAASATTSAGSKPSQMEMRDVLSDPTVIQVQEILGGKIRKVSRMNPSD